MVPGAANSLNFEPGPDAFQVLFADDQPDQPDLEAPSGSGSGFTAATPLSDSPPATPELPGDGPMSPPPLAAFLEGRRNLMARRRLLLAAHLPPPGADG